MPKRKRYEADPDDSDASYLHEDDEDVFDVDVPEAGGDSDTDATSVDDPDAVEDEDLDLEIDLDDQVELFGGNVHPPEYYQQAIRNFNEAEYESEDYSDGTTLLMDTIEAHWNLFCQTAQHPHGFKLISIALLYHFFDWKLNQKFSIDQNGKRRKLRGTTKRSSLGTYWKVFRLAYERAEGDKIDPKLNRSMHKVLRTLAKKHGLSDQRRANRCLTVEDLEKQIETTLSTTKKSFKLGELRIYAVLFLLLIAPAGARPTSVLRLRFSDLLVLLARDPEGGPHNILIKFTLAFTKTYLGEKDAKTYPLPETLFAESLLLSPHIFLLGILFRHRAFRAPNLASPHQLKTLDIHPDELELQLPLREDLDDVYVFRRAVQTLTGYDIAKNEPISYGMMAQWIKRIGEILGLEIPTIPYNLRYNAANEWTSSMDVSEALRNLAMDHANSIPLQRHYLGRDIDKDIWSVIRKVKSQHALVKQSCSVGHSISKRRPVDLTAEQSASVVADPMIRRLTRDLQRLRPGSPEYIELRKLRRNEKQRLRRELKQQIREKWTAEQAVKDIEHQLQGIGFEELESTDVSSRPQLPAQKRLMQALTASAATDLEGQYRRRDNAIAAVIAYCTVLEGCTVPRRYATVRDEAAPIPEVASSHPARAVVASLFVHDEHERPLRCFMCVGRALTLSPDDPLIEELIKEFFDASGLARHFKRRHLSKLGEDESSSCELCVMQLDNKMHVKSHARKIHGTGPDKPREDSS